jgi:hypothetical protein
VLVGTFSNVACLTKVLAKEVIPIPIKTLHMVSFELGYASRE